MMLFHPGHLVATPGVLEAIREAEAEAATFLRRHLTGDWGDVDAHDRAANNRALREGTRLLSAYHLPNGVKIWIITEADRASTTILLPEEY